MIRILYTTPVLEHPAAGGPALRVENSIKALNRCSNLYVYSRASNGAMGGQAAVKFYSELSNGFFAPLAQKHMINPKSFMQRSVNFISRKFISRNLIDVNSIESRKGYGDLLRTADRLAVDIIWLGFGNISYPLLRYIKDHSEYKVVLDTDSVWSRFLLRGLSFAEDIEERREIEAQGTAKEKEEHWGTQLADVTLAVSEVDAEYYRHLAKHPKQVRIFSNAVDEQTYKNVPRPPAQLKKPCLYLAGTFWPKGPMDNAARWIVEDVLPLVREEIPDIHLYIVGKGSDRILADIDDSRITITGKLPSVLPYLCNADVTLVPLKFESGTRFKILEAGMCGIPVVSTVLGAEGIPVRHEKNILLADSAEEFAASIVRLISDRDFAKRMADNLRTLVREQNSVDSLVDECRGILDYLMIGEAFSNA